VCVCLSVCVLCKPSLVRVHSLHSMHACARALSCFPSPLRSLSCARALSLSPYIQKKTAWLSQNSPIFYPKCPAFYQTSPIVYHKNPTFCQKSPTFYQKSFIFDQKSHTFYQKSPPLYARSTFSHLFLRILQNSPTFYPQSPIFYHKNPKEPYILSKEP